MQLDPRMFDRGPKTSYLIGQAIGNMAQRAGETYLQSKIQSMLEGKQQAASAKGIASLYPEKYREQIENAYSQLPLAYHGEGIKQAHEFIGAPEIDFRAGVPIGLINRGGSSPIQPPQMQQVPQMQQAAQRTTYAPESLLAGPQPTQIEQKTQPPTPTAVAANIDALQRMGQGLPPTTPAQLNAAPNVQVPMGTQQPPPSPETVPFEDLTRSELNSLLKNVPRQSDRNAYVKDWEKAQADKRAERVAEASERKASVLERKERREEEAAPKEFLSSLDKQYASTLRKRPIFKEMEKSAGKLKPMSVYKKYLTDRLNLPPGFLFTDTEQVLDKLGNQLAQGVSSAFDQARILQTEVETFIRSNPSLLNTPEGMQKLARISMAMDDITEKKWKYGREIRAEARKKGEALPEDLAAMVLEKEADFVEEAGNKIQDIMSVKGVEPQYKPHDMISKEELKNLPIGTKVKKGDRTYQITVRGIEEIK